MGLLGQRLGWRRPLLASWPKDERPLGRSERIALQEGLAARELRAGPADGIIGANTRRAVRAFQQSLGLPADGYPTRRCCNSCAEHHSSRAGHVGLPPIRYGSAQRWAATSARQGAGCSQSRARTAV